MNLLISKIPTDWFLFSLRHVHTTEIKYGNICKALCWSVYLKHISDYRDTHAVGDTPEEALENAIESITPSPNFLENIDTIYYCEQCRKDHDWNFQKDTKGIKCDTCGQNTDCYSLSISS